MAKPVYSNKGVDYKGWALGDFADDKGKEGSGQRIPTSHAVASGIFGNIQTLIGVLEAHPDSLHLRELPEEEDAARRIVEQAYAEFMAQADELEAWWKWTEYLKALRHLAYVVAKRAMLDWRAKNDSAIGHKGIR